VLLYETGAVSLGTKRKKTDRNGWTKKNANASFSVAKCFNMFSVACPNEHDPGLTSLLMSSSSPRLCMPDSASGWRGNPEVTYVITLEVFQQVGVIKSGLLR
jgi:hypothetical protein